MRPIWRRLLISLLAWASLWGAASAGFPSDDEVLQILKARVDTFKQGTGIVVGMVDSTGTRFVSYGTTHAGGSTPVNEHTIYEIGSISKVFTALVLADMVRKGEADLRDPVQTLLPSAVSLPELNGRRITLKDLVTHRSGLPRMPDNLPAGFHSEHGEYSVERMHTFLSECTLVADIGEKFLYSNLGFGLLGQALANRDGSDLETVLGSRITRPLGLIDTRFQLSPEQESRRAGGHDWNHAPMPLLNFDSMMGAGSLKSTAADLTRFLALNTGLIDSDLWSTLQLAHVDRENAIGNKVDIGMGWLTLTLHGRELILHNGATFGNMSFAGFDKEARRGVVVLANARGYYDDIGLHLLDPEVKLFRYEDPPEEPVAVEIDVEKLRPLEGEYAIAANQVMIVRIRDGKVYGNYNEGIELEMKAASETELFFEIAPFVVEFIKNKQGDVTEAVSRYFGREQRGKKLDFYRSPPKRAKTTEDLDRYVGRYKVSEDLTIEISIADNGLMVASEGQLPMKLIRTPDGFFAYEARAELVFDEGEDRVIGLTIHQNGEYNGIRLHDASGGETP